MTNWNHVFASPDPPKFKNKINFTAINVNKSSDISLNCEAEGIPPPQYEWTENGVNLSNDTEYLNIIQINESTRYLCRATNYLRSIVKEFYVIVNDASATPAPDVMTNPQAFVPKGIHNCVLYVSLNMK